MTHPLRTALLLLALLWGAGAQAQDFPDLTGRVVDNANYLSPAEEAELTARLEALETATGHQMVVVTLPDLKGGGDVSYPEDDFTYRLGRHWGIGSAERDDGLILLIADEERRVRIEVGYGLEPVVTDALAATIIRDDILPNFRAGDMAAGVIAGADALIAQLERSPAEAAATLRQNAMADTPEPGIVDNILSVFATLFVLFLFIGLPFIIISAIWRAARGGVSGWSGGGSGWSSGSSWSGGSSFDGGGGGFSGGGGSFGGGGASGGW